MHRQELDGNGWNEDASQTFIDHGRYFVPNREEQIETIVSLIPPSQEPFRVLDLCCGEGLLAEAILDRFPACTVIGCDGSPQMLRQAAERNATYGARFQTLHFDLADRAWRTQDDPVRAVVSSLAIHHLDSAGKRHLFGDVFAMLEPGGAFIIADVIEPTHPLGWRVAAEAWDEAVRERAQAIDGTDDAFGLFAQEKWNMYRHFDPDDIDKPSPLFDQLQWLTAAGFTAVDVYWMRAGHAIFGGYRTGAGTEL